MNKPTGLVGSPNVSRIKNSLALNLQVASVSSVRQHFFENRLPVDMVTIFARSTASPKFLSLIVTNMSSLYVPHIKAYCEWQITCTRKNLLQLQLQTRKHMHSLCFAILVYPPQEGRRVSQSICSLEEAQALPLPNYKLHLASSKRAIKGSLHNDQLTPPNTAENGNTAPTFNEPNHRDRERLGGRTPLRLPFCAAPVPLRGVPVSKHVFTTLPSTFLLLQRVATESIPRKWRNVELYFYPASPTPLHLVVFSNWRLPRMN